jgi:hypothetical protein
MIKMRIIMTMMVVMMRLIMKMMIMMMRMIMIMTRRSRYSGIDQP